MTTPDRHSNDDRSSYRWSAEELAALIRSEVASARRREPTAAPVPVDSRPTKDLSGEATRREWSLAELSAFDHSEFVDHAFVALLGRRPDAIEHWEMLAGLLRGDTKTWLLGKLCYGAEGRARGVRVRSLGPHFAVQSLFRLPLLGPVLEWLNAVMRLSGALRYHRAAGQAAASDHARLRATVAGLEADIRARAERLERELAALRESARAKFEVELPGRIDTVGSEGRRQAEAIQRDVDKLRAASVALTEAQTALAARTDEAVQSSADANFRIDALEPRDLPETLEISAESLAERARGRIGVSLEMSTDVAADDLRYALFESVFYESAVVAVKQRVYVPYLDRAVTARWPFLDLGCGRGEFMRILRDEGVGCLGVDLNAMEINALRAAGFEAVRADLVDFLERDRGTYSGAALLQVAEHLTPAQFERALELLHERLADGALLIIETPNPLSPFALGHFHTDPTHVAPLPPERVRFSVELAGFKDARTLFQSRIPGNAFGGPDPRAHYCDYAIVAVRR